MKAFPPNDTDLNWLGPNVEAVRITREWNSLQQRWEITIKDIPGGDIFFLAENCPRLIIT